MLKCKFLLRLLLTFSETYFIVRSTLIAPQGAVIAFSTSSCRIRPLAHCTKQICRTNIGHSYLYVSENLLRPLSPFYFSTLRSSLPFLCVYSSYSLLLSFYLFRYYFHSSKDKERLKNKWSELYEEEKRKGQNFRVLLDKYSVLAGGGEGAEKNFLG